MSTPVTMPQLGETVAEGTVTRWLRAVGEYVELDEPLLEVSTDKVDTEVTAPASGTLLQIIVAEDATVPVGEVIALIGDPAGRPAAEGPRHRHSPRVRRLAVEHGVTLDTLAGTGPTGRVTRDDVLRAATVPPRPAQSAPVPPTPVALAPVLPTPVQAAADGQRRTRMSRLRRVIADRMVTSLRTTAQLTTVVEVDMSRVVALVERARAAAPPSHGVRLTPTAFFARAAAEALRAHPLLNAGLDDDGQTIVHHTHIHLGVAVDTPRGLMVPVLRDAGGLNLLGIARRTADLAGRARAGELSPDELTGGTFTITNTGSRGALFDTPILNPPQTGILGTGAIVERPVVVRSEDGERAIVIRSMAYLALTYDHRLIDGADAARFLTAIRNRLEAGRFADELI